MIGDKPLGHKAERLSQRGNRHSGRVIKTPKEKRTVWAVNLIGIIFYY